MKSIYDVIKDALVKRGWKIDKNAVETLHKELHEFISPKTGEKMAIVDAIYDQLDIESLDDEED